MGFTSWCLGLQAFAKQEVQAAIMDCTQNPMHMMNYQNNPEVMMVSHPFLRGAWVHACISVLVYMPCLNLQQMHAAACHVSA